MKENDLVTSFLQHCVAERNLSRKTVYMYTSYLRMFFGWAQVDPDKITKDLMRAYLAHLVVTKIGIRTRATRLAALKTYTKFLQKEKRTKVDPLGDMERMRVPKGVPKPIQPDRIMALLAAPDVDKKAGLRDRAVMELLYGSGLRISEACELNVSDLDLANREARVVGKGEKTRLCPISQASTEALEIYLSHRGHLEPTEPVFLGGYGARLLPTVMARRIKRYAEAAGIPKHLLTPHKLRHSYATHMLDEGADIRVIQELMGHSSLATTQVYTQVSQKKQQEAFKRFNPRDKMGR